LKKKKAQVEEIEYDRQLNDVVLFQRVDLLDKLGQVQIDKDELALLHSVKHIGNKTKR